ncbi:MAG TPA: DNA translocase FtsK 4TM domain-containing protein, partial [Alphaproteobacteria bacterium]|nr:DNA translocase FtsK 4TM domain-containing protein [Alphaproteobacteria bacterium]
MARKYKIKTKKKGFFSRIIPEPAQAFVARRIIDGTGLVMACGGLFILGAIISYHHTDPSWNSAGSTDQVQNWFGRGGANISDLLLQTFGAAGTLIAIAFIVWGASIWRRRPLSPFWSRLVALIIGVFVGAVAVARIPAGEWLAQAYLGGSAGQLMYQNVADMFHSVGISGYEYIITTALFGALSIAVMAYACAVSRSEAKYMASMAWFGISTVALAIADKAMDFYDWVRHYGDTDYEPARQKRSINKPVIAKKEPKEKREVLERVIPSMESSDEDTDLPVNNIKVYAPQETHKSSGMSQTRFQLFDGGEWELPSLDLLQEVPD